MSADPEVLSAGARVGHILELLEAILLDVDMRTLLVSAQRVNKRWWNLIGNPEFQKRLFFIPDHDATGSTANPLLVEYFRFCFPNYSLEDNANWRGSTVYKDRNPPELEKFKTLRGRNIESKEWFAIKEKAEAFGREDASWRQMLTHQPPMAGVHQHFHSYVNPRYRCHEGYGVYRYPVSYQEQHVGKFVRMSTLVEYFFRSDKAVDNRQLHEFPPGFKSAVFVRYDKTSNDSWWWRRMYRFRPPHGQVHFTYNAILEPSDAPCPQFESIGKILLPRRSLVASCVWYLKSKLERSLQLIADFLNFEQEVRPSINGSPRRRLYIYFQNTDVERLLRKLRNPFRQQPEAGIED
ncbi:hypothetical protein G7054_g11780 [Neopestalotiopsis clavispora]|nr:hypothetical protein G7054_g11780 [Neopestalotiopsis clavispora]